MGIRISPSQMYQTLDQNTSASSGREKNQAFLLLNKSSARGHWNSQIGPSGGLGDEVVLDNIEPYMR